MSKNKYHTSESNIDLINLIFYNSTFEKNSFVIGDDRNIVPEINENIENVFSVLLNKNKNINKLKLVKGSGCDYYHVFLNLKNPILLNLEIRKALAYSIDKLAMSKRLFEDVSFANSFIFPGYNGVDKIHESYEYSLKKAEKILFQEGWKFNKQKKNRYKNSEILELSILANSSDLSQIQIARFLSEAWERLGIKIYLNVVSHKEFIKRLTTRNYSGAAVASFDLCQVESIATLFSYKNIPNINNNYKGLNISSWINERVEKFIYHLNYENNVMIRNQLLSNIQNEYVHDLPAIPLFFKKRCALVGENIKGYVINSHQKFSSDNAKKWRVLK